MPPIRRWVWGVLLAVLHASIVGAMRSPAPPRPPLQAAEERYSARRALMGTVVEVTVYAPGEPKARAAIAAAFDEIERIERLMSLQMPESELWRCNREAAAGPTAVSADTFEVLRRSREFSAMSDGAFDVTVTPLLRLWRDAAQRGAPPGAQELQETLARVGWRDVELDAARRTVRYARPGMALDLGAIAKGYAVDAAVRRLRESGIASGLVNAGGDVYVLGRKPDGTPWVVGVQDPRHPESERALVLAVEVADAGVATSGNYRRFSVIGGRRYSHIVDPRTGEPADAVPSVSVIARDATTADALATALSVMGVEKGLALVEGLKDVEALMLTIEDDRIVRHASSGFSTFVRPAEKAAERGLPSF